jgi:type VI secretion system protein
MSLSLKIISYHRLTPGQQAVFEPKSESFTIGRNDENDWTIPDPQRFLSGVHCRIHRENDQYYLTDISTNGVYLNGAETRVEKNSTVVLKHQDKIRIGDYEFETVIESDESAAPSVSHGTSTVFESGEFEDNFDDPFADPLPKAGQFDNADDEFAKDINTPLEHIDNSPVANAISIESLLDLDDLDEDDDRPSADNLHERHNPLNEAFKPASHIGDGSADRSSVELEGDFGTDIPDNWDEATGLQKAPESSSQPASLQSSDIPNEWDEAIDIFDSPEAEPVKKHAPVSPDPTPASRPTETTPTGQSGNSLAAFIHGAGLKADALDGVDEAALFEQVGKMMLEFTDGLVQTLSGRTHIKSEFRLDQTMIRPVENNPLKFSTSKTGTLRQLLTQHDSAYKSGVEAIREGFDDVNAHQMAVVAGMEAAVQDILKRFNPKTLETRLESDSILDNFLPGGKKAKYWEMFKLLFDQIAGEAEDDFQQLFGRKFSRAYEKQLHRLKNKHED